VIKTLQQFRGLILTIIVLAQFAGTSLWFAGNAVLPGLHRTFDLPEGAVGYLTSAVQLGFILGTLIFAFLSIADRFSPSRVFFACAVAGGFANAGVVYWADGYTSLLVLRFLTGFFLAGIYPVGMKIAADYFEKGLGRALGYLVGALVLGTAFPHLLSDLSATIDWKNVLLSTSVIAATGGLLVLVFVPDGPFRKQAARFKADAILTVFREKNLRAAAFGYFGHMWELYAFWAFVPFILHDYNQHSDNPSMPIALWSFIIIGIGFFGCLLGGELSTKLGSKKVAFVALLASGVCCLISPFIFNFSLPLFIAFMLFWGLVVIADSPQFSTLVAQAAPKDSIGTALTLVNSIGFAITIASIQLLNMLLLLLPGPYIYTVLALGPIIGLVALTGWRKK